MARRAGAEYGGSAFPAFPASLAGRGLVAIPLQLVGEILEAHSLMDLDDVMLDWRSLVFKTLAGFRSPVVSGDTGLCDGDLLHVLDTYNGGGSLFVFPGLSLCFYWLSLQQLGVKARTSSVNGLVLLRQSHAAENEAIQNSIGWPFPNIQASTPHCRQPQRLLKAATGGRGPAPKTPPV